MIKLELLANENKVETDVLVYEIMKSYHLSKRVAQDYSFSFGDKYRNI